MKKNNTLTLDIPQKLLPLYETDKRFIVIYGGRGSAKSWSLADFLIIKGYQSKQRFLCCREVQNSIKESVHKLLCERIDTMGFSNFFTITDHSITGNNGTEFIFKGLWNNYNSIKSMEGIDICWIEEAHSVSRASLEILTPTIRKPGSQIIFTYNPTNKDDPVHEDYTLSDRDDTLKIKINYEDNPWFPDVLRNELEYDKRVDFDKYLHKWEGECVKHSEAQIFYGKWKVENFESPENQIYYYGADWGFSVDPTALVRCFIIDKTLFIDYESYGVKIDIDKTPALFDQVPGVRNHMITADSARPETISYMQRNGFKIQSAVKGKGSVEDGISHLRSFEKIVVHERCRHTIDELRNYCYKVDKHTGEISTVPEDKSNHTLDALRYALEKVMMSRGITVTKSFMR